MKSVKSFTFSMILVGRSLFLEVLLMDMDLIFLQNISFYSFKIERVVIWPRVEIWPNLHPRKLISTKINLHKMQLILRYLYRVMSA